MLFLTDLLLPFSRQGEDARSVTARSVAARSVAAVVESKACVKRSGCVKEVLSAPEAGSDGLSSTVDSCICPAGDDGSLSQIFCNRTSFQCSVMPQDERCPQRCP